MTLLGIIGGGQLARMLALAAHPLGIDCLVVEPTERPPAAPVAEVIHAPYDDERALDALAARCDAVTVELEAVPIDALTRLGERVAVHPSPSAVAIAADRLLEKQMLRSVGVATAPFDDEVEGVLAIVKTRRGGFDGRGNRLVRSAAELADARSAMPFPIVEGLVPYVRELSIICARSIDGEVVCWPVGANVHETGILRRTTVLTADDPAQAAAASIAAKVATHLGYVGVLAVELFALADGTLVANELAPRVHNSGHWTIDGASTSQFEQHVRAVCGLPLGSTSLRAPSVMLNAVGRMPAAADVLRVPGAHLHDYGKAPRPGRKVGHVTITADDLAGLDERVAALERVVPFDAV